MALHQSVNAPIPAATSPLFTKLSITENTRGCSICTPTRGAIRRKRVESETVESTYLSHIASSTILTEHPRSEWPQYQTPPRYQWTVFTGVMGMVPPTTIAGQERCCRASRSRSLTRSVLEGGGANRVETGNTGRRRTLMVLSSVVVSGCRTVRWM